MKRQEEQEEVVEEITVPQADDSRKDEGPANGTGAGMVPPDDGPTELAGGAATAAQSGGGGAVHYGSYSSAGKEADRKEREARGQVCQEEDHTHEEEGRSLDGKGDCWPTVRQDWCGWESRQKCRPWPCIG